MGIIAQKQLFSWQDVENIGDLERLVLVLEYLPDEELVALLKKERDKDRDDYPVEPTWNSIIAGVVYQHKSAENLRRELQRNGELGSSVDLMYSGDLMLYQHPKLTVDF